MPIHQLRPAQRRRPGSDLDQAAAETARRIIRETELDDTTAHWRALKRAYLAGHEDAKRA